MTYIQSATEFNRASMKGFWETLGYLVKGQSTHLLAFNRVLSETGSKQLSYLGVRDIPLKDIKGSAGRYWDFTPRFLPSINNKINKDRWRIIYTLVMTGEGFPPIQVYKVGDLYFVEDGHHRVSVANYLGWKTIQAHITEVILAEAKVPLLAQA
jgi:hypothetical protein